MQIIVDNDKRDDIITEEPAPELKEISDCTFGRNNPVKDITIVYGGTLRDEYFESGKTRRLVLLLDRTGRAKKVNDEEAYRLEEALFPHCESNDPHIIALGRLSSARVLCTDDSQLENDFTNPDLLDPPGSIYKNQEDHRHLIVEDA